MTWAVEHHTGSAQAFHDRDPAPGSGRQLWVLQVDRPTLVLGSTQSDSVVDRDAVRQAGAVVARRRSGGGAVHLVPGGGWWVDVVIPRQDPRWEDDVSRSFHWLGAAWVDALRAVGLGADLRPEAHLGPLVRTRWSPLICFAGLGPGEVRATSGVGGPRKLVGISQRRTRTHARFQCVVHRRFEPWSTVGLLRLAPTDAADAAGALAAGVATLDVEGALLEQALLRALG